MDRRELLDGFVVVVVGVLFFVALLGLLCSLSDAWELIDAYEKGAR